MQGLDFLTTQIQLTHEDKTELGGLSVEAMKFLGGLFEFFSELDAAKRMEWQHVDTLSSNGEIGEEPFDRYGYIFDPRDVQRIMRRNQDINDWGSKRCDVIPNAD
jgi:hypothetical protein